MRMLNAEAPCKRVRDEKAYGQGDVTVCLMLYPARGNQVHLNGGANLAKDADLVLHTLGVLFYEKTPCFHAHRS